MKEEEERQKRLNEEDISLAERTVRTKVMTPPKSFFSHSDVNE
jgi:hypothetical protein